MADFFLKAGESILLTNQNIIVEKGRYEAILTDRRLILIRSDDANAPSREIPLREIGSVIAGENNIGIPTITLSHITADGVLVALELAFTQHAGDQNTFHYREWVNKLKERVKIAALEPAPVEDTPPEKEKIGKDTPGSPDSTSKLPEPAPTDVVLPEEGIQEDATMSPDSTGDLLVPVEDVPADEEKIHTDSYVSSDSASELPEPTTSLPQEPKGTPAAKKDSPSPGISAVTILIITLITAAIIIGTFALPNFSRGTPDAGPVVTPDVTASPSTTEISIETIPSTIASTITTTLTTVPVPTDRPVTTPPTVIIPPSGIWIRVQYASNFTGSVGVQGSLRNVEGTGDRFFQIPATGRIIDADIRKMDNSGQELVVVIYKNGTVVGQGSTKAPAGTISLSTWI